MKSQICSYLLILLNSVGKNTNVTRMHKPFCALFENWTDLDEFVSCKVKMSLILMTV